MATPTAAGPGFVDIARSVFDDHRQLLRATEETCLLDLQRLVDCCVAALRNGGKILLFGNGGSAADAQHIATELTVKYLVNRRAMAAIALTTDTSALTATSNDYGYEHVFKRQIEALGKPGDVAIGISTSGASPSILIALETAGELGLIAAGLAGNSGGKMVSVAEPLVVVPSDDTPRIQEMHILLLHLLCHELELRLS